MVGQCIAHGEAYRMSDLGEKVVRFANPLLPETRSELALPLICRGKTIGALTIQSTEEAAFTEEDMAIFQTMAGQLANAIANARLFEQAQQALEEITAIQRRYIREGWSKYLDRKK
jgi:GAF domain-containing protein